MKKKLKIDTKMCSIILSNKKVFGPMTLFSVEHHYNSYHWFFRNKVSGVNVGFKHFRTYDGMWQLYAYRYCLGEKSDAGTFAHKVSKMTHLSQFLMFYSAWLAKKKER